MARPTVIRNEVILDAARSVFLERGILATSAEVAQRAGVSEGSIFKRFKTKADLFRAAMGVDIEDVPRSLAALPSLAGSNTVAENLVSAGAQTVGFFTRVMPIMMMSWSNPKVQGCFPSGDAVDPPPLRAQAHVAQYLTAEINLGRIRAIDVNVIARAYMGALSAYVFSEMLASGGRGTNIDPQAYVEAYVDTLLTGMSPTTHEIMGASGKPRRELALGALGARPSASATQLQR